MLLTNDEASVCCTAQLNYQNNSQNDIVLALVYQTCFRNHKRVAGAGWSRQCIKPHCSQDIQMASCVLVGWFHFFASLRHFQGRQEQHLGSHSSHQIFNHTLIFCYFRLLQQTVLQFHYIRKGKVVIEVGPAAPVPVRAHLTGCLGGPATPALPDPVCCYFWQRHITRGAWPEGWGHVWHHVKLVPPVQGKKCGSTVIRAITCTHIYE
jgi:hypothetical protein